MKRYILSITGMLVLFGACKDEIKTPPPTPVVNPFNGIRYNAAGTLNFSVSNRFNSLNIVRFNDYITPVGDTINIDQFRYYLSNVQLKNDSGNWINMNNYNLIGIDDETSTSFKLENIPAGTYSHIRFFIGVDSLSNHSGAQDGALSPINDMFWSWSTGYIFFRLKGQFNSGQTMALDIGGDENLPVVELPLTSFKKEGTSATININCNVAEVFITPHAYDLKVQPTMIHSATSPGAPLLRDNIKAGVFSISSVQ